MTPDHPKMTPKFNFLQILLVCFVFLLSSFSGQEWSYYKIDGNLSARFPSKPQYLKNGSNHIWLSYLSDTVVVEVNKRLDIVNFDSRNPAKTKKFFTELKEGYLASQPGAKVSKEVIKILDKRSTYYFEFDALSRDGKRKIHSSLLYVIRKADLYKFGFTESGEQRLGDKPVRDFIYSGQFN